MGLLRAVISTASGGQQTRAGTASVGVWLHGELAESVGRPLEERHWGEGERGRREAARVGNSSSTGKGANSLVKFTEARGRA